MYENIHVYRRAVVKFIAEFLNSEAELIKANEACGSFVVEEKIWGTAIFHLS